MVHEAFGLDDVMRRQADRLASAGGFLTLAPDLFSAGGARRCLVSTMRAMLSGKGRAYGDIEAARQWLSGSSDCTGKIGVIGFCMGGGFALMTCARVSMRRPELRGPCRATSRGGGGCVPGGRQLRREGLRAAERGGQVGGGADEGRRGSRCEGVPHCRSYVLERRTGRTEGAASPGEGHGMVPDPEAAADAWRRIDGFFGEHLG